MSRSVAFAKLAKAAQLSAEAAKLYAEAAKELESDAPVTESASTEITEERLAAARKSLRRFGRGA